MTDAEVEALRARVQPVVEAAYRWAASIKDWWGQERIRAELAELLKEMEP